ncbi:MAG: hypothetical protein ABSA76_14645, partial [Bacteroidales bacterium]
KKEQNRWSLDFLVLLYQDKRTNASAALSYLLKSLATNSQNQLFTREPLYLQEAGCGETRGEGHHPSLELRMAKQGTEY